MNRPKEQADAYDIKVLDMAGNENLIVNPLLRLDLATAQIACEESVPAQTAPTNPASQSQDAVGGQPAEVGTLSALECRIVYCAGQGLTVPEIADRLDLDPERLASAIGNLVERDVLQWATDGMPATDHRDTFADIWRRAESLYRDRPLLIGENDIEFLWGDAALVIGALRNRWQRSGLETADVVVIYADHHPEYFLTVWAAWLSGLVVAPIDPEWSADRVSDLVRRLNPKAAVTDAGHAAVISSILPVSAHVISFDTLTASDHEPPARIPQLAEAIADFLDMPAPAPAAIEAGHIACILFTSGSTGMPKGVRISHRSLAHTSSVMKDVYSLDESDVMLSLGVPYAMSAIRNPCFAAVKSGSTILSPGAETAKNTIAVVETCQRHGVTVLATVPRFLELLVRYAEQKEDPPLDRLRLVLVTGTSLSTDLGAKIRTRFAFDVCSYYGLTETGGVCTAVAPGAEIDRDGIIGAPAGAVVQLVDDADRVIAENDVAGEIRVFSNGLADGYLQQEPAANDRFRDGWVYTGDFASRRPDGNIVFLGRKDDQIKSVAGDILFTSSIAARLEEHDAVLEAGVYCGERSQNRIIAFVVPAADSGQGRTVELSRHLMAAMGRGAVPEKFVYVDQLPRGNLGKINYEELLSRHGT